MKRSVKTILIVLVVLIAGAQVIRPAKNVSNDQSHAIATKYTVPEEIQGILKVACYDCHSNYTVYPWYAEIQPVGWWLANHVNDGKRHLNLSDFTSRPIAVQNHKLEEIIETVKEGEMPLGSYTWIHTEARLSQEQKESLTAWAQSAMDQLKSTYPADSLVLRRPRPGGGPGPG